MAGRTWAAGVGGCLTGVAVVAGFVSYDAFLQSAHVDDVVPPIGWWLLAVPMAIATTALTRFRHRAAAALAWVTLAAVLTLAGWLARQESSRPPTSMTTDSDVASVLFLMLCLVCWVAAFAALAGSLAAWFRRPVRADPESVPA